MRTPSSPANSGRSAASCRSDSPARLARRSSASSSTGASRISCAQVDQRLDLVQEPRVDAAAGLVHLLDGRAQPQRALDGVEPPVVRDAQRVQGLVDRVDGSASVQKPAALVSIERMALFSASAKLRPRLIASPTDFIVVVSSGSAPGNFSNANRGIFTTT